MTIVSYCGKARTVVITYLPSFTKPKRRNTKTSTFFTIFVVATLPVKSAMGLERLTKSLPRCKFLIADYCPFRCVDT